MLSGYQRIGSATLHLAAEIWFCKKRQANAEFVSIKDAAIIVEKNGRIAGVGPRLEIMPQLVGVDITKVDHGDSFLVPGFVDAHLHCPQLDVIGSGGLPLLGWLDKYVFPVETQFASRDFARAGARRLSRELRRHGITSAAVFSSVHKVAADELFSEFDEAGLRLVSGKTSMDRGAPDLLLQDAESDVADQRQLISKWHGKDNRLFYAITPRFALSCSQLMFGKLAELVRDFPTCFVQTHISENQLEVATVRDVWKSHKDYLAVYEDFGLLSHRTLLAHGIYLSPDEVRRVAKTKATIVHCPTSNTFLGSGLFDLRRAVDAGVKVCFASDIGGGTSLSPWQTMLESYKIQALQGLYLSAGELLYRATLAGAEAIGMDSLCGSFEAGKFADFVVISPKRNQLLGERMSKLNSSEEKLFALITSGDDRVVDATYVSGCQVYRNH